MESSKRFFLQSLMLCLIICFVSGNSSFKTSYGSGRVSTGEERMNGLEKLHEEKRRLETKIAESRLERRQEALEKDLERVIASIDRKELKYRTSSKSQTQINRLTDIKQEDDTSNNLLLEENPYAEVSGSKTTTSQGDRLSQKKLHLERLKAEKAKLEEKIAKSFVQKRKEKLEEDLKKITASIARKEKKYKRLEEEQQLYTMNEPKKCQSDLQEVQSFKNEHLQKYLNTQAFDSLQGMSQEDRDRLGVIQEELDEWDSEEDRTAEDFLAYTGSQVTRKLEEAQDLLSKTLRVVAETIRDGYNPVRLPYQDEIDELQDGMSVIINTSGEQNLLDGLLTLKERLETLLQKLHRESHYLTANNDIKDEVGGTELKTHSSRWTVKKWKDITKVIKNQVSDDQNKKDRSHPKAQQNVVETEIDEEIKVRRNAYLKEWTILSMLKAILQVSDLIRECLDEIGYETGEKDKESESLSKMHSHDFVTKSDSYEVADAIKGLIHVTGLMYTDLFVLYRTKISNEIIKIQKNSEPPPVHIPVISKCNFNHLVAIHRKLSKWADQVNYALGTAKKLYKGHGSIIMEILLNQCIRPVAYKKISHKTGEEEVTASMEKLVKEDRVDINGYLKYVDEHRTSVLGIGAEHNENRLRKFRSVLAHMGRVPEILEKKTQEILSELRHNPTTENKKKDLKKLELFEIEMKTAEEGIRRLFNAIMSAVKSTIEKEDRDYHSALEEYKKCKSSVLKRLSSLGKKTLKII